MDSLLEHFPMGHAVCVHDHSEGYSCRQRDKIQSEYFDVAKVSLQVTILYHHAVEDFDDESSTEDEPNTIKEHLFVISDDTVQDQDSVHKVQQLVQGYLSHIHYTVEKMHNFTDSFTAQNQDTVLVICLALLLILDIPFKEITLKPLMQKESKMQLAQI